MVLETPLRVKVLPMTHYPLPVTDNSKKYAMPSAQSLNPVEPQMPAPAFDNVQFCC